MKFKLGDRVKIIADEYDTDNGKIVEITKIDDDYIGRYQYKVEGEGLKDWFCDSELELFPHTIDNLEVGDVLVREDGNEQTVLGICDKVYFLSQINKPEKVTVFICTIEEIKEMFTLKSSEEVEELTIAEISKRLGKTIKVVK